MSMALDHDGWESALAYHWMIQQADRGRYVMVMPDITVDYGQGPEVAVYRTPYRPEFAPTLSPHPYVRALGYLGLALGAHGVAEAMMARQSQGDGDV